MYMHDEVHCYLASLIIFLDNLHNHTGFCILNRIAAIIKPFMIHMLEMLKGVVISSITS
jgi:hypothetical protein